MEPIVTALRDAIFQNTPNNADELLVLAHRIKICSADENRWSIAGQKHSGRLWQCRSKLCPNCQSISGYTWRRRLREKIRNTKLNLGESLRFVTFTIPKHNGTLDEQRTVVNHAWRRFTKSKWFRENFRSFMKSEEFTWSKARYNYHLHILAVTPYLPHHAVRFQWTQAVRKAFAHYNTPLDIATVDKLVVVNVLRVGSVENACREMSKYITKPTAVTTMPADQLIELASISRWSRMKEFGGNWRLLVTPSEEAGEDDPEQATRRKAYLDKTGVNAQGEATTMFDHAETWRTYVRKHGAWMYATLLRADVENRRNAMLRYLSARYAVYYVDHGPDLPRYDIRLLMDLRDLEKARLRAA